MENTNNWNAQDGADQQNDWQQADNNSQLQAEDQDAAMEFTGNDNTDPGNAHENRSRLYTGSGDADYDDDAGDDTEDDDTESGEDDEDDEDDAKTDWGNIDPQNDGFPSDTDPSGPGSAV